MMSRSVAATACSVALAVACLASASGCASLQAKLNKKLLDYATVEQDARITVSGTNGGFSAQNLIDGVTKVDQWNADAGWVYSFTRSRGAVIGVSAALSRTCRGGARGRLSTSRRRVE